MKRGFLKWFYVAVQFVMLAVSIPKVATLFHAYDPQTMGPLVEGIDIRSWLVGIAVDLTATLTTWAAMHKYEESRKRSALFAPGVIILACTGLSVVANYEDAATLHPAQYAAVSLFTHPALLINPILISAPPILVFLLILLVPSVLAQPRVKTAEEIEAETTQAEALIAAQARVRQAKARANAEVRGAQLKGLVATAKALTNQPDDEPEPPDDTPPPPLSEPRDVPALPAPSAKMTRAMWNALKLPERVTQSGVITAQEVADVLGVSLAHARNLLKEAGDKVSVPGRSGASYTALIDSLYVRRTKDSFAWARKLETTLGIRKRKGSFHVVPGEETEESSGTLDSDEALTGA